MLDAILQVENDKAVEILTDEIEERHIIKEEASQVLSTLALINKPTVEMLDKVLVSPFIISDGFLDFCICRGLY